MGISALPWGMLHCRRHGATDQAARLYPEGRLLRVVRHLRGTGGGCADAHLVRVAAEAHAHQHGRPPMRMVPRGVGDWRARAGEGELLSAGRSLMGGCSSLMA